MIKFEQFMCELCSLRFSTEEEAIECEDSHFGIEDFTIIDIRSNVKREVPTLDKDNVIGGLRKHDYPGILTLQANADKKSGAYGVYILDHIREAS
jgi:hypothetical protein